MKINRPNSAWIPYKPLTFIKPGPVAFMGHATLDRVFDDFSPSLTEALSQQAQNPPRLTSFKQTVLMPFDSNQTGFSFHQA